MFSIINKWGSFVRFSHTVFALRLNQPHLLQLALLLLLEGNLSRGSLLLGHTTTRLKLNRRINKAGRGRHMD
jgi:hypothetical protein